MAEYKVINKKREFQYEHRLVAEEKLGRKLGPDEVVHHIDGNKRNNDPDNLVVMTRREHALIHKEDIIRSKPVIQMDLNGIVIKEWPSAREAERNTKAAYQNIYKCCAGKRKTAGGYMWRYA